MFLQPSHFCVCDHLGPDLDNILVLFPIKRQISPHLQMQVVRTCSVYGWIYPTSSYIYILAEYILHHPISHHDYHPMNSHIQWLIQDFLAHGGLELARKINYQQYICISSIKTLILFCLKIWYPRIPNFPH